MARALRQDGRGVRPLRGFDMSAKSKAEESEIGLVKPGGLPIFKDTVVAGTAYEEE